MHHTSVTYKLKLSGGDIKAVQGDSGHAQADMVTEVYGHIIDEDRRKNAERMENAFYNKENLNPDIHEQKEEEIYGVSFFSFLVKKFVVICKNLSRSAMYIM